MATGTKSAPAKAVATPAKRGRKPAGEARPPLGLDLDAITPVTAPDVKAYASSELDNYPQITEWVKASRAEGAALTPAKQGVAKSVTIPASKATHLKDLIRRAALREGFGIKFERETPVPGGKVQIKFQAKDLRVNKPKETA